MQNFCLLVNYRIMMDVVFYSFLYYWHINSMEQTPDYTETCMRSAESDSGWLMLMKLSCISAFIVNLHYSQYFISLIKILI